MPSANHEPDTLARHGEAENAVVAIDLRDGSVTVLADGADFFSAPRLSPDGTRLAWLRWNHPNLPWDGTELVLADLDDKGLPVNERVVAGSQSDWIAQPRWSPAGILHFVAEPDGWMNLFRLGPAGRVERASEPLPAEFAFPDWVFGLASYAFEPDGPILAVGRSGGRDRLYRIAADGAASPFDLPFTEIGYVAIDGESAVFRAAATDRPATPRWRNRCASSRCPSRRVPRVPRSPDRTPHPKALTRCPDTRARWPERCPF